MRDVNNAFLWFTVYGSWFTVSVFGFSWPPAPGP
jgi:hypothetical protein